jgi:hypothetical protein
MIHLDSDDYQHRRRPTVAARARVEAGRMIARALGLAATLTIAAAAGVAAGDITWPPGEITLADGTQCSFVFGATYAVQNMRADYDCGDGRWLTGGLREEQDGSVHINVLRINSATGQGTQAGTAVVQSTSCAAVSRIPDADSEVVCP